MDTKQILDIFKQEGALLEGHFILSSGLRSPVFLQKSLIFQNPKITELLCQALADKILSEYGKIEYIVSPALGGIIPGYETARALGIKAVYVERESNEFKLRRGFSIPKKSNVVMVEDIVTTGLSSRECLESLDKLEINLIGGACIIDRSGGKARIGKPLISLAQLDFPVYQPDHLPEELAKIKPVKPGSRNL